MPTDPKASRRSRKPTPAGAADSRHRAPSEEEIIASLAGTSEAVGDQELKALFGDDVAELRRLASTRTRARKNRATAPKVYLLHGIMGSELGRRRLFWEDVIWLGLGDILLGNLAKLKLGPGGDPGIKALGFLPGVYLMMRLHLEGEGFEVVSHAYDWRRNLESLGAELRRRIAAEKQPVHVVAHSMGGLVTRAAFKQGMTGVASFLMLATPNHGSLAPVEALRGQYGLARMIAGGDLFHTAEELARDVFGTFPGLYQMILARRLNPELDLLDPKHWPTTGPQPAEDLLRLAENVQDLLAQPSDTPDVPWYLVAGIDQETKVAAKVVGTEFAYRITRDGDGTVPLESALLPGVRKTWFASAGHGFFANDSGVRAATVEILRHGDTNLLRSQRPDVSRSASWVQEKDLRAVAETRSRLRSATALGHPERLRALFGAPESFQPPTSATAEYEHRLEQVTIGRKTQRRLEIAFYHGSITDVTARAYLLGTFSGVTPSGASAALDNLMGGAIGDLMGHNMFGSRTGEVFILPLARRELRAEVGLFVGLGAYDEFKLAPSPAPGGRRTQAYIHRQHVPALEIASENAARLLARTHVDDFATVLLGGSVAGDMAATGESMLRGFLRGLEDGDAGEGVRRLVICETNPERYRAMRQHLVFLATTALCEGVEFVLRELDPPPDIRRLRALGVAAEAPRSGPPEPAYLLVRTEDDPKSKGAQLWKFALLGPSNRAAVREDALATTQSRLAKLLEPVANQKSPTAAGASTLGSTLARDLLPPVILGDLREMSHLPLVVLHDAEASKIPWETLAYSGSGPGEVVVPASKAGMSRRFLASTSACSRWAATSARADVVKILLVRNPTGDLEGAVEEARAIEEALASDRRF
ncbi:MAG: alpha/beta fold hydrolase, partial [Verrucomicrobiales bacterium]|nr:alpha/beta fold hydrolase [Verrucomicrobiales bacterium]